MCHSINLWDRKAHCNSNFLENLVFYLNRDTIVIKNPILENTLKVKKICLVLEDSFIFVPVHSLLQFLFFIFPLFFVLFLFLFKLFYCFFLCCTFLFFQPLILHCLLLWYLLPHFLIACSACFLIFFFPVFPLVDFFCFLTLSL